MALTDYQHIKNPLIQEKRITYDCDGWVKVMLVLDIGNFVGADYHLVCGDIVEWEWNGRTRIDTVAPSSRRRDRMLNSLKESGIDGYISFV
ncbi:MAG: hypothetical protein HY512_02520 [Candidatus Aenigmarchaeota archaeon]|nr:hypothetical protein [Candidatus Aenigmarchaeota archaeon]